MIMRSMFLAPLPLLVLLAGGCPPPTARSAVDPKLVVDQARSKDLPGRVEALRELSDKIVAAKSTSAAEYDRALAALEQALEKNKYDYDLLWRAARACFLVTEYAQDPKQVYAYGEAGRTFGERATKEQPKRVEGFYYLALDLSKMADAKKNLRLLNPAMAAAETAMKIDPAFDEAGPLRFLGKAYITAPAWPTSVGSPDKGVEMLQKAVSLAPVPINRLFLGEAYFHEEEYGKAKAALEQALSEGKGKLHERWQKEGEDYLRRVKAKSSS
jgi:tetratricopeptide (TPR) repeat protein